MRIQKKQYFNFIELLVVLSVMAILFTLLFGSLEKLNGQAQSIECQNKLRVYGTAYGFYLEDNHDIFPIMTRRSNGRDIETSQLSWLHIRRDYPDIFETEDSYKCPTFYQDWSSQTNYRGYTGVYSKGINDLLHTPNRVAVIGDGIKANLTSGYCFWETGGISETSLGRDRDAGRYRQFHPDDFLHTGNKVNATFADLHVESMDPFYMLENRTSIWNRAQ